MIPRRLQPVLEQALASHASVALLGPRQVGKTTLAFAIKERFDAVYLDMERLVDQARMEDFESFYAMHGNKLVIIDEIYRGQNGARTPLLTATSPARLPSGDKVYRRKVRVNGALNFLPPTTPAKPRL